MLACTGPGCSNSNHFLRNALKNVGWSLEVRDLSCFKKLAFSRFTNFILNLVYKNAKLEDCVLDVDGDHISIVIGTVYMEMPMKPNVLEELEQEVIAEE
jgi:hypothetical protein